MTNAVQVLAMVGTGILTGGVGVAFMKGWFSVKLRRMDQHEKEMIAINERYDKIWGKYLTIIEEHAELKGKSESQEHEIQMTKRTVKQLSGYRNQQLKINRLTKALNEYYKTDNVTALVKAFEKELL